jgi:hypothetical protein
MTTSFITIDWMCELVKFRMDAALAHDFAEKLASTDENSITSDRPTAVSAASKAVSAASEMTNLCKLVERLSKFLDNEWFSGPLACPLARKT